MSRILLVEDEEHLAEGLAFNLRNAAYDVDVVSSGEAALEAVGVESTAANGSEEGDYDLVLLDVMLPGIDGMEVCKRLRKAGNMVPVVILSARDRTDDIVAGVDAGADDYLTKPFDLDMLLA
ncbi:MAG: response regulator, partial [Holophagales bacterium]|nr:response regulator [Holophagales bacterium]